VENFFEADILGIKKYFLRRGCICGEDESIEKQKPGTAGLLYANSL
jgi:hypothetical protein